MYICNNFNNAISIRENFNRRKSSLLVNVNLFPQPSKRIKSISGHQSAVASYDYIISYFID